MLVKGMPDTCTARHFFDFRHDGVSELGLASQKRQLIDQLNQAKLARIVNVFAFLTARQTTSAAQLEELGFTKVADYHNYKYPATSSRLFLYSMDMNNWTIRDVAAPQPANPFAVQPQPANPVPPRGAGPYRYGSAFYVLPRQTGRVRRRSVEAFMNGEFPVGVWVDVPAGVNQCPDSLRGEFLEVKLASGVVNQNRRLGALWEWGFAGTDLGRGSIIAVKRVA